MFAINAVGAIGLFFLLTACSVRDVPSTSNIAPPTPSASSTPTQNPAPDYFAHISPAHGELLRQWLKSEPNFRPASEDADSALMPGNDPDFPDGNVPFLRETVGSNGNQYYAVGDMNQDKHTDFAVLLVDTRERSDSTDPDEFALAIFNGPFGATARPAYFERNLYGISNSYIVYDLMEKGHLFLGKFESDVYCATYYRKGKTYRFEDCI